MVTAVSSVTGCGDDTEVPLGGGGATSTSTTGGGGAAGGEGGMGGDGGAGGGTPCLPNQGVTFALTSLYFGQGASGEWKAIGKNLDGLESDATSTDVCLTNSGGDPDLAYPDGDNGIDNSFGKNLLPLILGLVPSWPDGVTSYLEDGRFNAMMKVYCLPDDGDAPQLTTKVFGGTDLGMTPLYDGSDVWPVVPELLSDLQDPESSTLVFENSSVTGSMYDSGTNETFVLTIPIEFNSQSAQLKLTLYAAHLTMDLSSDRRSATGGIIGGVLDTEEFIDQVKKIAFMGDVCGDQVYQDILSLVRQSSDIMNDGTQNPATVCNGISFGVAFEMAEVQLGNVGPTALPGMACP